MCLVCASQRVPDDGNTSPSGATIYYIVEDSERTSENISRNLVDLCFALQSITSSMVISQELYEKRNKHRNAYNVRTQPISVRPFLKQVSIQKVKKTNKTNRI